MRPYVKVTSSFPVESRDSAELLKVLNLLLRAAKANLELGEMTMSSVTDFGAAMQGFFARSDAALEGIKQGIAVLQAAGPSSPEDQMALNDVHANMERLTAAIEEVRSRLPAAVPPMG